MTTIADMLPSTTRPQHPGDRRTSSGGADRVAQLLRTAEEDEAAEHGTAVAIGIVAAASGANVVGHGLAPLGAERCDVATLPDVGTMIDFEQNRIPHLVVEMDDSGATITPNGLDPDAPSDASLTMIGAPAQLARDLAARVDAADARVVVIIGHCDVADELACALVDTVHPLCRVIADPGLLLDGSGSSGVRHVLDTSRAVIAQGVRVGTIPVETDEVLVDDVGGASVAELLAISAGTSR